MTQEKLIKDAVDLAYTLLHSNEIEEEKEQLTNRAKNWLSHMEITDAETLAAVIITGNFDFSVDKSDLKNIKDFYFPDIPIPDDYKDYATIL